ncbi:MAG: hypothetical protein AABW41_03765 [Nanoarchaeota archaeon]
MHYKSIIDKIKTATLQVTEENKKQPFKKPISYRLEVSSYQLIQAVVDLFNLHNSDGMRNLYEYYKDWMLAIKSPKTKEEKIKNAQETLDSVCMAADVEVYNTNNAEIGPIRNFYRSAICYKQD